MTLYTDGANSLKKRVGAWAYALVDDQDKLIHEGTEAYHGRPTNNEMELCGCIFGLEFITITPSLGKDVTVISDSEYVVLGASERLDKWIANNWKCTAGLVKNRVLWEAIEYLKTRLTINWQWVRGHDGDKWNEYVDKKAVESYRKL